MFLAMSVVQLTKIIRRIMECYTSGLRVMNNVKAILSLLILLCLILTVSTSSAIGYTVGVTAGHKVKYNITATIQGKTIDAGWMRITIENVAGTIISGSLEGNGTVEDIDIPGSPEPFFIDVAMPGYSSGSIPNFIFIPSNLTAGSSVPGFYYSIEGPTTKNGREAVYINASFLGVTSEYYWDRSTGVLLEFTTSYGEVSSAIKIAETDLWGGGLFGLGGFGGLDWWIWVIIIVAVVAIVAAFVGLTRRKRKPPAATLASIPPPPPPPPPP